MPDDPRPLSSFLTGYQNHDPDEGWDDPDPTGPVIVNHHRPSRGDLISRAIATAAVVIALVFAGNAILEREHTQDDLDAAMAASNALANDVDLLRDQVEASGQTPAAPPANETLEDVENETGIVTVPGPRGEDGPMGPMGPVGPEGPVGKQGPEGPIGPKGDTGATGADGEDGADGTDGADGAPGADGRGIASQECVGGDLVTTYTDGTQSSIVDSPACPQGPPVSLP